MKKFAQKYIEIYISIIPAGRAPAVRAARYGRTESGDVHPQYG